MNQQPEPIRFSGLHHLALVCRDMERTVDFYSNVLEMPLTKGFDLEGGFGQHFFFDIGNGDELAFFWFRDAPPAAPGVASAGHLVGTTGGSIVSAHGSMNHVALQVAPDRIEHYHARLTAKGVECTPIVNHQDVVTGQGASRTSSSVSAETWLRSFYFFDPDGIMLEFCATVTPGAPDVTEPVDASGRKAGERGG